MMDREIDSLIAQEADRIMEELRLEERVQELETKLTKQSETMALHVLEKQRWDKILTLAGHDTEFNGRTFNKDDSTELLSHDDNLTFTSKELGRLARMGLNFEAMLEGIQANETLQVQWDNLLMTMRMYHKEHNNG